ncbi:unnamed protein product, partial [marine sediment metagenome]
GAQRTGAMQSMAEIRAQHDTFALSDNPHLLIPQTQLIINCHY